MKPLLIETYKIAYKFCGFTTFSYLFSYIFISILNLITLWGLGFLCKNWLKFMQIIDKLFAFPWIFLVIIAVLYNNFRQIPSMRDMSKEKKKDINPWPFTIYTIACICIFIYIKYQDDLFPVLPAIKNARRLK